ncbi:hypothetical protein BDV12DRAFT_194407 [Aspergillus spectabilis]
MPSRPEMMLRNLKSSLNKLEMNTTLSLDSSGVIESDLEGVGFESEKWFFINGIGGEPYWVKSACNKIAETFQRGVTGVFNRSEGLLWDLIEKQQASSKESKRGIKGASSAEQIIVIAHSQGCLLLRLVLQQPVTDNADLLGKLRVFTFGDIRKSKL